MSEFERYRSSEGQIVEIRPFEEGETLSDLVYVTDADRAAGSPKAGDRIVRSPDNYGDQMLISAACFAADYQPAP